MSLQLRNVSKCYGEKIILRPFSVTIPLNTTIAVLGNNGSGKTTLLKMISGLEEETNGSIHLNGSLLNTIPIHKRKELVTYCPPFLARTLNQNVEEFFQTFLPNLDSSHFLELFQLFHLEKLFHQPVVSLSSGQWKRILLAKTLAQSATFTCLDEPETFLDQGYFRKLQAYIQKKHQESKQTTIFSTHNLAFAMEYADLILFIAQESCVFFGEKELFLKWQHG